MRKAPWFIHCLIRAEGMLDDLATPAENLRSRLQSLCHAIERVLVFEARDGANILRAARVQRAGAASLGIAVIDFFQFAQFAFADRRQRLAGRTNVDVLFRVVAELVLAEKAARNDAPHIRCASFSAPRSFPLDSRPANRRSRAPRRRPRRAVSDNPPASCRPPSMNFCKDPVVKLRSLLLTALMRVPSTASNSRPNRSRRRHRITNSRKTFLNAARLSLRKSAIVLKSGFRPPSSQMISMLR